MARFKPNHKGVLKESLMKFLFPAHLEQPDSTCRLDVFAYYGPCDDNAQLRGGTESNHTNQDHEIKQMGINLNRETFFELYKDRKKQRGDVEIVVEELMPLSVNHTYADIEIKKLIAPVKPDKEGRLSFPALQRIIIADHRRRLTTLMDGGRIDKELRFPIP